MRASLAMIIPRTRTDEGGDETFTSMDLDLVGHVSGCDCIIVDDMIDTAGALCIAANELTSLGARRVFAFATHGLFSGPAAERIEGSSLEEVVVANTIPLAPQVQKDTRKVCARHGGKATSDSRSERALSALNISMVTSTESATVRGRNEVKTAQSTPSETGQLGHSPKCVSWCRVIWGPPSKPTNQYANPATVATPTYSPMRR